MSTEALFAKVSYPRLAGELGSDNGDQAIARGYAAGYAAGARAAADESAVHTAELTARAERSALDYADAVRSAVLALQSAAIRADQLTRPVLGEADAALAAAALEIAEAILGRELENHEASARAAVERALAIAGADEVLVVRMNPADIAVLGAETAALTSASLVPDLTLERGDAVVETPVGTIDARISTATDRVRAILLGGAA